MDRDDRAGAERADRRHDQTPMTTEPIHGGDFLDALAAANAIMHFVSVMDRALYVSPRARVVSWIVIETNSTQIEHEHDYE